MIEGLIAGLHEASEACTVAAGVHRRKGELEAAAALDGMALALRMRASEEVTPVDHDRLTDVAELQTRWQRFLRWWIR